MKERPILFSAPMVRAIVEGRKTQTRQVVCFSNSTVLGCRDQNLWEQLVWGGICGREPFKDRGPDPFGSDGYEYLHVPAVHAENRANPSSDCVMVYRVRPIWQAGDRLWVRETWAHHTDDTGHACIVYKSDGTARAALYGDSGEGDFVGCGGPVVATTPVGAWKRASNMPQRASRLTLEIVAVRVERLQEISVEDAIAEGVLDRMQWPSSIAELRRCKALLRDYGVAAERAFPDAWDSVNAKRGHHWANNPWVWVLGFQRIKEPA